MGPSSKTRHTATLRASHAGSASTARPAGRRPGRCAPEASPHVTRPARSRGLARPGQPGGEGPARSRAVLRGPRSFQAVRPCLRPWAGEVCARGGRRRRGVRPSLGLALPPAARSLARFGAAASGAPPQGTRQRAAARGASRPTAPRRVATGLPPSALPVPQAAPCPGGLGVGTRDPASPGMRLAPRAQGRAHARWKAPSGAWQKYSYRQWHGII